MEDLKELIVKYFEKDKKFHTELELRKKLNIKGEKQTDIFNCALKELIEDGCLFFDFKNGYRIFTNDIGLAYGEIEINKAGNGFVHTKDNYTIFIKHDDLNGALHGDKVIVNSIDNGRRDEFEGKVDKILKRKNGKAVFEVVGNGYDAVLIPNNKNEEVMITINKNELKSLVDGELVIVSIGTECINDEFIAHIESSLGFKSDPDIDIKLLANKYNIPIEFSKEALDEADNLPTEVCEEDLVGRIDLRDKEIITIDCDNTKDRDDAVYVEKLDNGNYKLITSIASINYYVKKGSKLFEEALERNTSHYPNNTCIPMFPKRISNGICSLNEKVDRLTKSCEMEINSNGEVVDYKIYNSVIKSRKAMKYSEVNEVLNGNNIDSYEEFRNQLILMDELSTILEKAKIKRDYMNFDIPDIEIIQDENGKPLNFKESKQGKAEKLIENFMLITNTTVAENYSWFPFIYRIHETPNEETVKGFIDLLNSSGFNIPNVTNINERTLKGILEKTKCSDKMNIIRTTLLKSMKRARYDTNNIGHFALQLEKYCHFTSPIRRIADFMVHTIIDDLENFEYTEDNINKLEKDLYIISQNASTAEKNDRDMEYEAMAMIMAEYMENHIGEEFEAYITEVYQHGMFAKTKNMISGKIRLDDILDDKYLFDYKKNAIVGKKNNKRYRIGDKVYVIVKSANKENRTIDFEIGKQKSLRLS